MNRNVRLTKLEMQLRRRHARPTVAQLERMSPGELDQVLEFLTDGDLAALAAEDSARLVKLLPDAGLVRLIRFGDASFPSEPTDEELRGGVATER